MEINDNLENMIPYKPGVLKEGVLKLSSNENRLGSSPKAIEAIKESLGTLNLYPDGFCKTLKRELAIKWSLEPWQFIVGNGSDELMALIAATYVSKGDKVMTSESTFSEYTFAAKLFHGEMNLIPLKDGRFDSVAMVDALDEKCKIIYFCNPNNPTGTYNSHQELIKILDNVPTTTLFVLDEAYGEYSDAPDFPDSQWLLNKYPNLIVLRTFSKIYGLAALRIGYGVASRKVVEQIHLTKQPFNVNTPAQMAAVAALNDREFYEKSRNMNQKGKLYLYNELDRMKLKYYKTQANFICINVAQDSKNLFKKMMQKGVTIRALASFNLNNWIRITIGKQDDNELFIKILEETLT